MFRHSTGQKLTRRLTTTSTAQAGSMNSGGTHDHRRGSTLTMHPAGEAFGFRTSRFAADNPDQQGSSKPTCGSQPRLRVDQGGRHQPVEPRLAAGLNGCWARNRAGKTLAVRPDGRGGIRRFPREPSALGADTTPPGCARSGAGHRDSVGWEARRGWMINWGARHRSTLLSTGGASAFIVRRRTETHARRPRGVNRLVWRDGLASAVMNSSLPG